MKIFAIYTAWVGRFLYIVERESVVRERERERGKRRGKKEEEEEKKGKFCN